MKITSLKPGMVVYDVHKHRMGNTTMRTLGVWLVRIIEVDPLGRWVKASWNGNPTREYYGPDIPWRKNKPVTIKTGLHTRLATKEEINALKN